MPCLNCGELKTIEAHLIPKAFVSEVKFGNGEQHLILHHGKDAQRVSNTGVYDQDILCGPCDARLGQYEGYAFKLLKQLRARNLPVGATGRIDPVDGDGLVRFAAGIAWKYAKTKPEFGRISIEPYADLLRNVSLQNQAIPASVDLTMFRLIELDGDVYHYRTPIPDRQNGVNFVRFSVGGFIFFLKIDKRDSQLTGLSDCWLRGRSSGSFPVFSAYQFEEGQMHAELATGSRAIGFFKNMIDRRSARKR